MLLFVGVGGVVGALLAPKAMRLLPPQAGIYGTLVGITALLPLLAVGAALQYVGGVATILALFAIMLAATTYALLSKHIRNVPTLAVGGPPADPGPSA
jgi:hypothetical protein